MDPLPEPKRGWLHLAALDIRPLRHRDFRLLVVARTVSFFGSMITYTAVPYQLFQLTHSVLVVGALSLVEIGGVLAFALLGGALADARDRRLMVLATEGCLLFASLALAGNSLLHQPQAWLTFALVGLGSALDSLQRPSLDAMLPRLVERDELVAASAIRSTTLTAGMIAGPAIAGVLIGAIGLPLTYVVDVATFAVGFGCLSLMKAMPPPPDAERPSIRRVVEGLRYARSRPELIGTYAVDIIALFFGMPNALFPAIAQRLGGPSVLGLMYAAPAVGAFLFSGTSGWTNRIHRHGMALIVAALVWGLAIIGFGVVPGLVAALVFLTIAGAADMMSGVFRNAIWNQTIPDNIRGRLASIELLSYSIGPTFGNFEAGVVASLFSIRVSIVSGGVLCVVGCLLAAAALPALRSYDNRTWKPASVDA